jgi:iron complex outermembrane receptor protein
VARINTHRYAISARGFNSSTANKLLVLIDGRTVYTPLYSGVFWDAQQVMLEDVERIEVISGPGGTLWGANAVNGVINVITRAARDTQGTIVAAGAGNLERSAAARTGGKLGENGHYRIYGQIFDRSNSVLADRSPVRDAGQTGQGGFRADFGNDAERVTLQGDAYRGRIEQIPGKREISGVNLLARWDRRLKNDSALHLQTYYDHTERNHPTVFSEKLDTFDIEFNHALQPAAGHKLIWGAGYRYARDRIGNSATIAFLPAERDLHWGSVFIQDQIALGPDLEFTLGLKAERNRYTGVEYLPDLRLAWSPDRNSLLWSAWSRAVRAPARIDREFFAPANPPFRTAGGANFRSEVANVLEVGYRAQPTLRISYSVTAFHHAFDRLRSVEQRPGGDVLENRIDGTSTGIEAWGNYRASDTWRLSGGLVAMNQKLRREAGSTDVRGLPALGNDPNRTLMLRSSFDLTPRHELDFIVRHAGELPDPAVPSYTAVDTRLGWRPRPDVELSLSVQNLFDAGHPEFGAASARSEVERSVFLKSLWRL